MVKVTNVRVTRTQKLTVVETVVIDVNQDDDDHKDPAGIAEDLVKALIAAGHDVDWTEDSETPEAYPAPRFNAEIVKDEPHD